ncbi:Eco57I restriction-modification methylase domain-containing protein [Leisingera caerulea]|uniref:Eco57I restriction-modification methylase domain-containing protein n=1 Tax=Leisingera caerulea TaxID=506591 RepID=UPI0021A421F8|nr:N-6 DNA methylase [Leisingera caerulea]UWQ49336.1 Eco57I restriction-modification methylase domain-containing protein [Leisingera caerulea]
MVEATMAKARYVGVTKAKSDGATYTPAKLAGFVADRILANADLPKGRPVRLLDPAVGHGELLLALLDRLNGPVVVCGYETDQNALGETERRLAALEVQGEIQLRGRSFLEHVLNDFGGGLFCSEEPYDLIIANPPYIRTQILGAGRAKQLAAQFELSGRVDMYHAFLLGMVRVLAPDGAAGFIVSNRFMTTKGGASVRHAMQTQMRLSEIYDLGDTKMFDAAVLPAVLVGRGLNSKMAEPKFSSIYQAREDAEKYVSDPLEALQYSGVVGLPDGRAFNVRHGVLDSKDNGSGTWRLASPAVDEWLAAVESKTWGTFRDVAKIRVGVKTTADKVFIPKEWEEELELLKPLTTHHTGQRFRPKAPTRKILYTHFVENGKRNVVNIENFPKSKAYLETHRSTLEGRKYVADAGRKWYEIWVPQNPEEWSKQKLVFRDISEKPMFWMDMDETVVNGDCYWMAGKEDHLWLALAVGNSSFIERFYDHRFNNKLYAGRRRFITQYVELFPLPDPTLNHSREIISKCRTLYAKLGERPVPHLEAELDQMVWEAFGLKSSEIAG